MKTDIQIWYDQELSEIKKEMEKSGFSLIENFPLYATTDSKKIQYDEEIDLSLGSFLITLYYSGDEYVDGFTIIKHGESVSLPLNSWELLLKKHLKDFDLTKEDLEKLNKKLNKIATKAEHFHSLIEDVNYEYRKYNKNR